jgi:hypothetical protein
LGITQIETVSEQRAEGLTESKREKTREANRGNYVN